MRVDDAIGLWQDGERRLRASDGAERAALDGVVEAIVAELRRRLGGPFASDALAALYEDALDWSFDLATRVAPTTPAAWDVTTVTGAAFARYVRQASDWAGGRRIELPDD